LDKKARIAARLHIKLKRGARPSEFGLLDSRAEALL
jgi:hypothetical protein